MTDLASARHSETGRLASLDLLRLFAALSVVGFHYFFRGSVAPGWLDTGYPELAGIAIYGYLGVSLFFMISGFVIAWSAEGRSAGMFAVHRFARIYPAFFVCMSITTLVLALGHDQLPISFKQWLANIIIFAPAAGQPFVDGVYWSIVLELVFYGWMTLAIASGQFAKRPDALVCGWLILAAANEFGFDSSILRMGFVTEYAAWFAAGIILHRLRHHGRSTVRLILLAASLLLAIATSFRTRGWMLEHYGIGLPDLHLVAAVIVLFAIFIAAVSFGERLAPSRQLLALGGLTYPLYLLHQNIGYVALNALTPMLGRWLAAAISISAMLILAYVVWAWIEPPARRWLLRKSGIQPVMQGRASTKSSGNKVCPV